jgi:hypothetical protein
VPVLTDAKEETEEALHTDPVSSRGQVVAELIRLGYTVQKHPASFALVEKAVEAMTQAIAKKSAEMHKLHTLHVEAIERDMKRN